MQAEWKMALRLASGEAHAGASFDAHGLGGPAARRNLRSWRNTKTLKENDDDRQWQMPDPRARRQHRWR